MIESEFSKLLGAASRKIPELAKARAIAEGYGFRIALYGGPSRELIRFVLENGRRIPESDLHWLDWHWVASDFDILALALPGAGNFDDLSAQITKLFSGNVFYRRVELRLASRFFEDYPLTESHYETISNLAISERGVEDLSTHASCGLAQFEKRELDFRVNSLVTIPNSYRDLKQALRWIRLAAELPQMKLIPSSRLAIHELLSRVTETSLLLEDPKIKEALEKIHWYSRDPHYTKFLLEEFGIDSPREPLPTRAFIDDSRAVRLGNETRVYLKAHISDAQSFSKGAHWRETLIGKSTLGVPEPGKIFLGLALSADAILGTDLKPTGDGYEILTTNAIARNADGSFKIDRVTHSQFRDNLVHRFKFNQELSDGQFRQLLALLSLKPT